MTVLSALHYRTTPAITAIDRKRRKQIHDSPSDPVLHENLLKEFPVFEEVEERLPEGPVGPPSEALRFTAWNLERCKFLDSSAAMLARSGGDVHLLSEMDHGMARSGQGHKTRELAERIGCGYLFGVEWLELDIGDEREQVLFRGQENDVGFHGNAILSARRWKRPALIRLETDGFYFEPSRQDRRVGGRAALLATFEIGGVDVTCASVHLEAHSDPRIRAHQMRALLDGIEIYSPGAPAVIGGDLNTTSLARRNINRKNPDLPAVSPPELMEADAHRLVDPVPYEPLFELAAAAGFDWRACNKLGVATQRTRPDGTPPPPLGRLDWFLTRGMVATDPRIAAAVDPEAGTAISDHELLAVTVSPVFVA